VKAVQLLINSLLPEDLRDYNRVYDSKSIGKLLAEVAEKYPQRYAEIAGNIADVGRKASYLQGETLTLDDLKPTFDRDAILATMDNDIASARQTSLNDGDFNTARRDIWTKYSDRLEKLTSDSALKAGNNLAYSVISGARGKGPQMKAMITTPGVYEDYKGEMVPLFVRNSFSQGLRPAEFIAGTFGARSAVLATKRATADGGDLSKQWGQIAGTIAITSKDCGTSNGIDLDPADASLRNRVLVKETDGIPAGTVIDRNVLKKLHNHKGKIIARSVLTCQNKDGVCAKCAGLRMDGKAYKIGDSIGVSAAQSLGEPITQASLNQKHTAGQAKGKRVLSGFDVIDNFVQSPETFPDKAEVSSVAGRVARIEDAPQGGQFIYIEDQKHYVKPGYELMVKPGDVVEAGEQLSDGIVDAADVVKYRGLGEGRRYYAERLKQVLDDSGLAANQRNTEALARAAIDHVVIDDAEGVGDYLPDDVASYNTLAADYTPSVTTRKVPTAGGVGKYLQAPALHYSVGTKLTPKMVTRLSDAGIADLQVDDSAPKFYPQMVRLRSAGHNNPDWLAQMSTSYIKDNLADSAVRGRDSDVESNHHWAPRLAFGKNFGESAAQTGKF
jgi:DNA-directed RNA polymerase subunit beta'